MKSLRRTIWVTFLSIWLLSPHAHAQNDNGTSFVLADLKSTNWQRRADTYYTIKSNSKALDRLDVKSALIDLLSRENELRHTTGNSKTWVGADESYAEYVSDLAETVARVADWKDQRQLCVLADSPYEPDSVFAARLVEKGGAAVVSCLIQVAQGDEFDRYDAISVLVQAYGKTKLPAPVEQQVRHVIESGLHDDAPVRQSTVEALGKFGGSEWIPALQAIARNDPVSRRLDDGQMRFDVREAAAKAIQSIQDRARMQ